MEKDISSRIEELIAALGLVPNSFAIKLKMTPQGLGAILNRRNKPSYDVIQSILNETDVNSDWLLKGIGEMFVSKGNESLDPYLLTAKMEGDLLDQDTLLLPVLDARAAASYSDNIYGTMTKLDTGNTYRIIKIPSISYEKAFVMNIIGDSMLPNFRNGMKVIVRVVPPGRWSTATGIHAVSIKSGMFTMKRIWKNLNNVLYLKADNPDIQEELEVQIADILALFRVGEIVYAPPVQDI